LNFSANSGVTNSWSMSWTKNAGSLMYRYRVEAEFHTILTWTLEVRVSSASRSGRSAPNEWVFWVRTRGGLVDAERRKQNDLPLQGRHLDAPLLIGLDGQSCAMPTPS
jgi:hypothetical protein